MNKDISFIKMGEKKLPNTIWKSQNCGKGTDLYLSFLQVAFCIQLVIAGRREEKHRKQHTQVNFTKSQPSKRQKATAENHCRRIEDMKKHIEMR